MPSLLVENIGREWRNIAMSNCGWEPTEEERPGRESQGFWVRSSHLRGYLKPSKDGGDDIRSHPRAAHEKIASDLAFDLSLPVSPAVLVDGTQYGGKSKAAVVSLVLFREILEWPKIAAVKLALQLASHVLRDTRTSWSGVLALDAWLANTDRQQDTNFVIGLDPINESPLCEPVFCDFANSMIHSGWADGTSHKTFNPPSLIPALHEVFDRDAALAVAAKIADFNEGVIEEIVTKIPPSHLLLEHQPILINALVERRRDIPSVIEGIGR